MNANIRFREATREGLPDVVHLLSDDPLGSKRELDASPLPESYYSAFEAIDRDPNNELVVAEFSGAVVGSLQITFIPYVTYRGSWRAFVSVAAFDHLESARTSILGLLSDPSNRVVPWSN